MSSLALDPMFTPFSAIKVSEELLYFTFVLKTGGCKTLTLIEAITNNQFIYIDNAITYGYAFQLCKSLCADDWVYERPSYQFYLGDMMHLEVIVKQFMHVPLRVFVDYCVAEASPGSPPEYVFIDNHG